jgi:flagellar motor protein MotB
VACAFVENETNVSIPLTFDWLTLAWLKLRLGFWWKSRRGLRLRVSPRQLVFVLVAFALASCVPVTRFEETQSAAQVEMAGRHRAEQQISQLKAEIEGLRASLSRQGTTLDERGDALAQAELDKTNQGKERADAEGMVEQLRGELARVGGHLQTYHADKQKLEATLAVEAARGRALARLSRDVTLTLTEPIATGEYTLDAESQHVVLRVPRDRLLAEDGAVKPEADALLKAVARVLSLHPQSKLQLEDASAPADAIATSRVVAALAERAVAADRFEPLAPVDASAPAAPAKPGSNELIFGFSVP